MKFEQFSLNKHEIEHVSKCALDVLYTYCSYNVLFDVHESFWNLTFLHVKWQKSPFFIHEWGGNLNSTLKSIVVHNRPRKACENRQKQTLTHKPDSSANVWVKVAACGIDVQLCSGDVPPFYQAAVENSLPNHYLWAGWIILYNQFSV